MKLKSPVVHMLGVWVNPSRVRRTLYVTMFGLGVWVGRHPALRAPTPPLVVEVERALATRPGWTSIAPDAECRRTKTAVECDVWPRAKLGRFPVPPAWRPVPPETESVLVADTAE